MNQENVESFQGFIDNYETIVKELQQELYYFKNEQDNLKQQLKAVINENTQLSRYLQSAKNPLPQFNDNEDLIDNLKCQISALINEKECVSKLWQEGVKTIDLLEDEVKLFQSGYDNFVPKNEVQQLKINYEAKLEELELQLTNAQKKLLKSEARHSEIDQHLENQTSALKIVKNLESEVLRLQKRLQDAVADKNATLQILQKKEEIVQSLKTANGNYLNQVREAVSCVEAALNEKDSALFREQQTKDENVKLVEEMTEIVKQTHEKIKQESLKVSIQSAEKQQLLMEELSKAQTEAKRKCEEIEEVNKKCSLLEKEIERCKSDKSDINKLLILEKNLEGTFQKLLVSEKLNIQLTSDQEVIKNDLEQMANIYDRNLKAKEVQLLTLKSKINRLETELNESHEKINNLTATGFKEQHNGKYESKIAQLTQQYEELQTQMEMKQELHQKWRKETKIITNNLEKLATNLKREVQQLKKTNKTLKQNLTKSEEKVQRYKTFFELVSKDVDKISHLTLGVS